MKFVPHLAATLSLLLADAGTLAADSKASDEPSVRVVNITSGEDKFGSLTVEVVGSNESFRECLASGLELQYRVRARLCRRRTGWFDSCADPIEEVTTLQINLVSGTARVVRDRLGDKTTPRTSFKGSEEAGLAGARMTEPFSLVALAGEDQSLLTSSRTFLDVRVNVVCKGEQALLRDLAEDITLGLLELKGYDSGWQEFVLPQRR